MAQMRPRRSPWHGNTDSLHATSSKQSPLVQNYSHGFLGCQRSVVRGLSTQGWDNAQCCSMLQHAGQTERSCSTAVLSSSMTIWHSTQSRWPHRRLNSTDGKCCSIHHTVQTRHLHTSIFLDILNGLPPNCSSRQTRVLMQADPTVSTHVIRVSLLRDLIHHFPTWTSASVQMVIMWVHSIHDMPQWQLVPYLWNSPRSTEVSKVKDIAKFTITSSNILVKKNVQ